MEPVRIQFKIFLAFAGIQLILFSLISSISAGTAIISSPSEFASAWKERKSESLIEVKDLFGRVLHGREPKDFLKMTDNADRKIIFYMGSAALQNLMGRSGYQSVIHLGYTPEYIALLKNQKKYFQLLIFKTNEHLIPATWDNVIHEVAKQYPKVASKILAQLPLLKTIPFVQIHKIAVTEGSPPFSVINKTGKMHPNYFSEQALEQSLGKLWEVRAFLYFEARLTELFAGDGHTFSHHGERGVPEFVGANMEVASLPEKEIIPLEIDLKECIHHLPELIKE
ncbi:MAG: hypothetical protein JWQ35_517 [Bacteriovoracaceae bacterium]|nr:hypothetical protein [Bacteriovoracaceae bacterium]